MTGATEGLTAERTLELVAERLTKMAGEWTLAPGPMLRGPGRTAIVVGADHTGGPQHLDLHFVIDIDQPARTRIPDCAIGFEAGIEAAARQAIDMWADTTATVIIELFARDGRFGDHFNAGDPQCFPGWHLIRGGIVGWGIGASRQDAPAQWLADNPPWVPLAPIITAGLDRPELNGVKFVISSRDGGAWELAEVRINGVEHEPASRALRDLDWPRTADMSVAKGFALLVHPEDAR